MSRTCTALSDWKIRPTMKLNPSCSSTLLGWSAFRMSWMVRKSAPKWVQTASMQAASLSPWMRSQIFSSAPTATASGVKASSSVSSNVPAE